MNTSTEIQNSGASLSQYLVSFSHLLPGELIGESLPAILASVETIPWPMVSILGFEVRLDERLGTDFLCSANKATGGRDILAGTHPFASFEPPGGKPNWNRVLDFCRRWADPTNVLYNGADDIWFEFDTASGPQSIPSFFFGPKVGLGDPDEILQRTKNILKEGLTSLLADAIPPVLLSEVDRLLAALPPHARIFQTGLMLSRPGGALRVCLDNLRSEEIRQCLNVMRGESMAKRVASYMQELQPFVLSFKPSFDLGEDRGGRIGLECYCDVPQLASAPEVWVPLLDRLVVKGLCTVARRELLLGLPSVLQGVTWPEDSFAAFEALLRRERGISVRLHHVKLTIGEQAPVSAKAYVALQKTWIS